MSQLQREGDAVGCVRDQRPASTVVRDLVALGGISFPRHMAAASAACLYTRGKNGVTHSAEPGHTLLSRPRLGSRV